MDIKRLANTEFKAQRRGGRGVQGMSVHDDDYVENMISCSTHDSPSSLRTQEKLYQAKGYEIWNIAVQQRITSHQLIKH